MHLLKETYSFRILIYAHKMYGEAGELHKSVCAPYTRIKINFASEHRCMRLRRLMRNVTRFIGAQ